MRKLAVSLFVLVLLGSMSIGCMELAVDELETTSQPTIFGDPEGNAGFDIQQIDADTLDEVHGDPVVRQVYDATVALFDGTSALTYSNGQVLIDANPVLDADGRVCIGDGMAPFRNEPAHGFCSGFMVGPDLIATAGHCLRKSRECRSTTFVFGYSMANVSNGVITVDEDDVYECSSIVAYGYGGLEDWSLIRTDRPIVGHQPIAIRRSGLVETDTTDNVRELMVVGHPWGIPGKFADSAVPWRDGNYAAEYFTANLDHFGGNSGSIVVSLKADGSLYLAEGILVRGYGDDWVQTTDDDGVCWASGWCPEDGCGAGNSTEMSRTTRFASYVPADPVCGDSSCNGDETCDTCPGDCGACPECGDGFCNGDETCVETGTSTGCLADCGTCPYCGDGTCDDDETCDSCPGDCGDCPVCEPKGEACTTGADCCSGRCHPRKDTCQ